MKLSVILLICYLAQHKVQALPNSVTIGVILGPDDIQQEQVVRYSVDRINADRGILPRTRLGAQIKKYLPQDSFHTSKGVCSLLKSGNGVAAIFGPQSAQTSSHVTSICAAMGIPHVETRWESNEVTTGTNINLYPHAMTLTQAYLDLVKAWEWKTFAVLYENNDGLIRLQEFLKVNDSTYFQIHKLGEGPDYMPVLKIVKNSGLTNIILDCNTEKITSIMKQLQQNGMMNEYYKYLITSLDLHTINLNDYKNRGSDVRAFRLVNLERPEMRNIEQNTSFVKTESALLYDAVQMVAKALHDSDSGSQRIDTKNLNCDDNDSWNQGSTIVKVMKKMEMHGLTGLISFDNQGFRTGFILDVVKLDENGLNEIGTWSLEHGINLTGLEDTTDDSDVFTNKTLVISSLLNSPYLMQKESSVKLSGNDQFEGYVVDFVEELSKILHFKYSIKLAGDYQYGSRNPITNRWSGIIGEVIDGHADLGITDLTITADRETVVDFSAPFISTGVSILYTKPELVPANPFAFLTPLSCEVWLYIILAYLGVSLVLFILARLSPYEWRNTHQYKNEPGALHNKFSIWSTIWFTTSTFMQQGYHISPKALSTRLVAALWWGFSLFMICIYIGNLAAFFTAGEIDIYKIISPIQNVVDLANQHEIDYGVVHGGSTHAFFKNSKQPLYQKMWAKMSSNPEVFVVSNRDGMERVQKSKGKYAFFMESAILEYVVERNCDLVKVGGEINSRGYGIAMKQNSPYRQAINAAILKMQENEVLSNLKTLWWSQKHGGGACVNIPSDMKNDIGAVTVWNVKGLFIILIVGLVVAIFIALCELAWNSRKAAAKNQTNVSTEMGHELRELIKYRGATSRPSRDLTAPTSTGVQESPTSSNGKEPLP